MRRQDPKGIFDGHRDAATETLAKKDFQLIDSLTRWVARTALTGAAMFMFAVGVIWLVVVIGGYPAFLKVEPGQFFANLRSAAFWSLCAAVASWMILRWYGVGRQTR